ncbi:MAG: TlyA family RNA methyltransferase [Pseudomonadota bacterium]
MADQDLENARIRLDNLLTQRGLAASRSRARDVILRHGVTVDGKTLSKPGALVDCGATIEIDDPAQAYVSRAALKLIAGLDAAGIVVRDKSCLDLGASTGGFTQVLLERGASHVTAIDVGHGQMVKDIADHPRVTSLEGINARSLTSDQFSQAPQIVVSDMSFISLRMGAEPALLLASSDAQAVLLVKPQFEVGRAGIGKGGLVNDAALVDKVLRDIQAWFNALDEWQCTHLLPSPIEGGDGNQEYLLCGARNG